MATLEFWLSTLDFQERFWLPVNPEQLTVKSSHGYEDVQVTQLGEFTIVGDSALREYSFSSFFPKHYDPGYCEYTGIPEPWNAVKTIEDWMKSRSPLRLDITGTSIDKVMVTVRSFQYSERAGSPGDVYYDLELKEYVPVTFRQVDHSKDGASAGGTGPRPDTRTPPAAYIVIPGDTLWKIAQRTLGNGDRWREVYAANRETIGKNPDRIQPGQKLVIPS
ncbi:LysM peptidoglycan-binding domain-containing protein [Paenibacillus sp. CN-4]|uniref:LysM peptidoglycan-binding domain-containing protein n=1 Tax=Paenibacillus nanchangensis TaxID=3348343 RepID=UPI003979BFE4